MPYFRKPIPLIFILFCKKNAYFQYKCIRSANLQHRTKAYVIGSVINHGPFIGYVTGKCYLPELES